MAIEVLTGLLVTITGFYAWVTYKIMNLNERTLTALQQEAEAATRPYVTISVFAEPNDVIFYLRIANTGRTGASNVRLTMDRDFYQFGQKSQPSLREASAFQQAIQALPPSAEMIFGLAQGFVVLGKDADESITPQVFSINATYSYGNKTVSETTVIDLRPYKESMSRPSAIADELKLVRKQLEIIARKS
ncbi:MAG: hypothetical protein F4053_00185 [Proteobacteria bacterium]|nr:hypothetical protein [Pseudomonadota bacterium]